MRPLADAERGLGKMKIDLSMEARTHLIATSEGDARRALNGLEIAALTTPPDAEGIVHISAAIIEECVQKKRVLYDRDEDQHYDTISAFIKSVRGSDPDSALYWLAKMIEAGEDPRFIARRLIILASEDIGLADPQGLVVAVAALHAVDFIGMPEGQIPPCRGDALSRLRGQEQLVRLGHRPGARRGAEGRSGPGAGVPARCALPGREAARPWRGLRVQPRSSRRDFTPSATASRQAAFFQPTDHGYEAKIKARLAEWEKLRAAGAKKKN